MKRLFLIPLALVASIGPAMADPRTRTIIIDRPHYDATRTTTRDPETRTLSRDTVIVRERDGAVATRSYDRDAGGGHYQASGSATGFNGRTRSFDYERTRNGNGFVASGNATGPRGRSLDYDASRTRNGNGYVSNRTVTNGNGRILYDRDVAVSRGGGQVTRNIDVTRARGFRPHRAVNRIRGRR